MSPQEEVGHREVIWLLGSLSGLYRLPFDAALVSQEFPPPYSIATFHEAARSLGLKTGSVNIEGLDWQKLPLPAIAFLRPVQVDAADREEIATAADPFVVSLSNHGRREEEAPHAPPSSSSNPTARNSSTSAPAARPRKPSRWPKPRSGSNLN
ncbi:MAG: hypothetical protein IPL58_14490 [Betaproteobacteria bacterium]|uniref:Uncharacterized protein n=1 Tax=Candidatus Proximibacter danicus TaxID=2954365 RepID=A0A9D7K6C6_9PROT|nr:hypothetical protein [Candidatus Proximibacter danicus]